jgi:uncharacterized protein (TIGR02001 family)
MKKMIVFIACLMSLSFSSIVLAAEEGGKLAAENFSGTVTLTSDYVFKGISYSSEKPAIQGSLDYGYKKFYSGIWMSSMSTSDTEASVEIDLYAGFWGSLGEIDYDIAAYYYIYPGAEDDGYEYNYAELAVGLSHTFNTKMATTIGVQYKFAPDTYGEDGVQHTYSVSSQIDLPANFGLSLESGYSDVEGDNYSGNGWGEGGGSGYDWMWYRAGVRYDTKGCELALDYWNTSDIEDDYMGKDIADSRVVLSISRSF